MRLLHNGLRMNKQTASQIVTPNSEVCQIIGQRSKVLEMVQIVPLPLWFSARLQPKIKNRTDQSATNYTCACFDPIILPSAKRFLWALYSLESKRYAQSFLFCSSRMPSIPSETVPPNVTTKQMIYNQMCFPKGSQNDTMQTLYKMPVLLFKTKVLTLTLLFCDQMPFDFA